MLEKRERFVRLSVREGRREPRQPASGIPGCLVSSIRSWMNDGLRTEDSLNRLSRLLDLSSGEYVWYEVAEGLTAAVADGVPEALDIVDALLFLGHDPEALDEMLWDVEHEYTVHTDRKRLVLRVDDSAWAALAVAVSAENEASDALEQAWAYQYGRNGQDASKVWDLCTRAVESVLKPLVSPNDSKATLGKMIQALEDAPHKWEFALPTRERKGALITGMTSFISALRIVGYNPSRHGGSSDKVQLAESAVVLHQAVAIVCWLNQGALRVSE